MRGPGRTARSSRQLGSRCVCFRECGELVQEAQAANHAIALEIKNAAELSRRTSRPSAANREPARNLAIALVSERRSVEPSARPAHRWRVVPTFPFVRVSSAQNSLVSSLPVAAQKIAPGEKARPLSTDSLTSRCDFFTRAGRSLLSCSRPAGRTERVLASAHRDGRRPCGGSPGACGSCGLVALAATAEQAPRGGRVNRSPLALVCPSLRSVRWSELLSSAARWRRV